MNPHNFLFPWPGYIFSNFSFVSYHNYRDTGKEKFSLKWFVETESLKSIKLAKAYKATYYDNY